MPEGEITPEELYSQHKEAVEKGDDEKYQLNLSLAKEYYQQNLEELQQEASEGYITWAKEEIKNALENKNLSRAEGIFEGLKVHTEGTEVKEPAEKKLIKKEILVNGKLTGTEEYKYDSDGRMMTRIHRNREGVLTEMEESEYNAEGRVTRRRSENTRVNEWGRSRTSIGTEEFRYNERGNLLDHTENTENKGEVEPGGQRYYSRQWQYEYSGDRLVREKFYTPGCALETTYEYDSQGRVEKESQAELGRKPHFITEYQYDEKGNQIKAVKSYEGKPEQWDSYTYDEKGRKIKSVSVHSVKYGSTVLGSNEYVEGFTYDERGNLVRKEEKDDIHREMSDREKRSKTTEFRFVFK